MTKLPSDIFTRVRQILLPLVTTIEDRDLLLTEAFYLENPLLYGIEREGKVLTFCSRCTKTLIDYGCLKPGEHALSRLLTVARSLTGTDKYSEIDALVQTCNPVCDDAPKSVPTKTSPSAPVTTPMQTIDTPRDERTPTVFISYSHQDADFAQQLIADLNQAGHACWIDTVKIKGGDEWVRSITEGINNSYAFISIVSEDANESTWVRREFLWAEYKEKLIFPVKAKPCELVIYLMERQVLDLHADYANGLADLLSVLPSPTLVDAEDSTPQERKPPSINRRRLELDFLEQLRADVLFDLEKYTPLGGESRFIVQMRQGKPLELAHMRPEFEHLIRHEEQERTRRFENAVEEILEIKRAILLGEPGGGKTTTLLSLAGELAQTAQHDPKAPLPLFVRLGRWTDPEQSLYDFIAEELGALGDHLQTLFEENRAVPLLDGMNEIPVKQRSAKYGQIKDFIGQYPDWVAVASCREQDYTIDLQLDRITVTPLDPLRVREFVRRYLGAKNGENLFWRIAGEDAHRFERRFAVLFADKRDDWQRVFWLANNLPNDFSWKYDNDGSYRYSWNVWRDIRDAPGSLMQLAHNPYMLTMLTKVYVARGDLPSNRGELFREFVETLLVREHVVSRDAQSGRVQMTEEARLLLSALSEVAYEMQIQRGQAEDGNALTVLPLETVKGFLNDRQRYLAGSTSILDISDDVRFTHQLLQEYFAAVRMNTLIFDPDKPLHASDIWKPDNWWERTNWEEAVILLAGLYSDDCSQVVEWVNRANPEIAALCAVRSGAKLPDATCERLRAEWTPRLTDTKNVPDPRARAAVGRALGLTNWDTRKGISVIMRDDGVKVPDIDWVHIPAGEFIYQDGEKRTLPAFEISRYPLTYVQFQAFIDDQEGFYDPRWWAGLSIPDDHNQSPGDQHFKYWNHPRENISWYDAIAFCRWLSWHMRGDFDLNNINEWSVRLPTEFEWERAARGTDGRIYPYGNEFDASKCNTRETCIDQTSAVGLFSQGVSPEGVLDMSGNVWEWCLTDRDKPVPDIQNENLYSSSRRVLRGGSWNSHVNRSRATSRSNDLPDYRYDSFGFRLCRPPSVQP